MWGNTIYELADPYNATINVCVKLCLADRQGMRAKAGRNVTTVLPSTGTVLVYGCGESTHQLLNLKAKRNCAISLGREGPGNCLTISGLLSVGGLANGGVRVGVGSARIWFVGESVRVASRPAPR